VGTVNSFCRVSLSAVMYSKVGKWQHMCVVIILIIAVLVMFSYKIVYVVAFDCHFSFLSCTCTVAEISA